MTLHNVYTIMTDSQTASRDSFMWIRALMSSPFRQSPQRTVSWTQTISHRISGTSLLSVSIIKFISSCLMGELEFEQSHPFLNMSVLDGEGTVNGQRIKKGDHFIIPAGFGNVKMEGKLGVIASCV